MRITLALLAALAALLDPRLAHATHFNRGHFVTPYEPCSPLTSNTATSDGVPACSPPVPLSNCATSPDKALRLGPDSSTSLKMEVSGRRLTTFEGVPTVETRVILNGIEDCAGGRYEGSLILHTVLRVHSLDPACLTGLCTLPDISYTQEFPCVHGRCRLNGDSWDDFTEQGIPHLPIDHGYTAEVITLEILDRGGQPFLVQGIGSRNNAVMMMAGKSPAWRWLAGLRDLISPREAFAYGATGSGPPLELRMRYVHSYAPCLPGQTNTTTADGQAACVSVPMSNCALDPGNAVVVTVPTEGNYHSDGAGKGKVIAEVSQGRADLVLSGPIRTLTSCSGAPYTGPLRMEGLFRTTVLDAACTGGACTTVDGPLLGWTVHAKDGSCHLAERVPFEDLHGLPGSTEFGAEVLAIHFLDRSGNAVLTGPTMLVRCNPQTDGLFCFGN
jgi:hypothetical protein